MPLKRIDAANVRQGTALEEAAVLKNVNKARCSMKISPPTLQNKAMVTVEAAGSSITTEMDFEKALLTLFTLKMRDC